MRETGVAYIFWCACLLGVCGVQRFYCGKYVSGIIYLFTVGLLGIGQLVDLALIPGMVEEKNLKYKLLHGSPNANMTNNQSVVLNLGEQVASSMSSAPQLIKNLIFKLFFN
ncbi:NINE protein [Chroococcidiopsidales cyanobacterium LEGE 13417]|nr:NINE protein [Chroococcidiopsidales cyanobacterium LEGE 13417]